MCVSDNLRIGTWLLAATIALLGCSPTVAGGPLTPGPGPGPGPGTDAGPWQPPPQPGYDAGPTNPPPTNYDAGLNECAAINQSAQTLTAPVDIVWVIDSSGSMRNEADIVQSNLNNFANGIASSGIDVHVVVITAPGYVSVPPPLGTNAEQYRAINQGVGSNAALQVLVSTYSQWSDFLREGSQLHLIAVTDDESGMAAGTFKSQFDSMSGRTDYKVHSIVSPPGSSHPLPFIGIPQDGCTGPHGDAADNGDQYWSLSGTTMGQRFSICTPDWSSLFTSLQSVIAVPMPLPCVFDIPDPPMGEMFDPFKVNLTLTQTGGVPSVIPNVMTFSQCTAAPSGWYYDNPAAPTRMVLCPNTCTAASNDMGAQISIQLGCATMLL